MNRGGHDGQIAPSVIELIPVAVVNVGAWRQFAVLLLCRPSVRLNPLARIGILILGVASGIDAGMKVGHCVPRLKGALLPATIGVISTVRRRARSRLRIGNHAEQS